VSPGNFKEDVKGHRRAIREAWKAIAEECVIFEKESIWPDQCDRVHTSLLLLIDPVQSFCTSLASVAVLPFSVIPFRYTLLMALHHISATVDELDVLLASFPSLCRSSSQEALFQKQKMQRKLADLEQCSEDIQQTVDKLLFRLNAEVSGSRVVASG
jgi:hypothetical protein